MPSSNLCRCAWVKPGNIAYETYHDHEWGVPNHDDHKHFEFLILEGAQAGLSWLTILKRREGYQQAFANFNPEIVARYSESKINQLIEFEGIIRNRLKVESSVLNAQAFLKVQEEFGSFDHYVWQFVDGHPIQNYWKTIKEIPPETKESKTLSKDLKKRGFKFVGSTIIYAYMQALGLVNDHTMDCFRHQELLILTKENAKIGFWP